MPPQGYHMPMMPAAYPMPMQPMMPLQPMMGCANPARDRPGMPCGGTMSVQQHLVTLQSSLSPAQREVAVMHLAECDWRGNPQIVPALLTYAKDDPAATVRTACVTGLMRMNAGGDAVTQTLSQLRSDSDPRVRQAGDQAM